MTFAPIDLELQAEALLRNLPVAVYKIDRAGRIVYYNDAAAALWGDRPPLGGREFAGSLTLLRADGTAMAAGESAIAIALRERRPVRAMEVLVLPPGQAPFRALSYATPQLDDSGELTGAVAMLAPVADSGHDEHTARHYAAIVESSEDAILSKDLNGVITSWNQSAERLFGYAAEEAVGQPVTLLIPVDRHDEEPTILSRIRRGERIDHYETVRRHKDGRLIDISLTVSPIKDLQGRVFGASKIARDITERKRAQEQQRLLLREMAHRVRNLFAISSSLVHLGARSAKTPGELATRLRGQMDALARAHGLLFSGAGESAEQAMTLQALIRAVTAPFDGPASATSPRFEISGPDFALSSNALTGLALLLNEFATNSTKYGALSAPEGSVAIVYSDDDGTVHFEWTERGGPPIDRLDEVEGFGSFLVRTTVERQLNGKIDYEWPREGLTIKLSLPRDHLTEAAAP